MGASPITRTLAVIGRPAGAPLRRLARVADPAVAVPAALTPGEPPGVGDRLLVLYDGACGICLHGRDLIARLDREDRLAHDTIQRHAAGLLAGLSDEARYGSWHVIHPDGRRADGGEAVADVLSALPRLGAAGRLARRAPRATARAYRWLAEHRVMVSATLGLAGHPQVIDAPEQGAPRPHGL